MHGRERHVTLFWNRKHTGCPLRVQGVVIFNKIVCLDNYSQALCRESPSPLSLPTQQPCPHRQPCLPRLSNVLVNSISSCLPLLKANGSTFCTLWVLHLDFSLSHLRNFPSLVYKELLLFLFSKAQYPSAVGAYHNICNWFLLQDF